MTTEIKVPTLGESVTEATVAKWFKAVGDAIAADEPLVELETDKVTVEVGAPTAGTLESIVAEEGAEVEVGALLGTLAAGAVASERIPAPEPEPGIGAADTAGVVDEPAAPPCKPAPVPAAPAAPAASAAPAAPVFSGPLSPAVRRLIEENNLDPTQIPGSGKDGRLTKGDVLAFLQSGAAVQRATTAPEPAAAAATAAAPAVALQPASTPVAPAAPKAARPVDAREERVRMTRLRRMVAARLKDAQNTAAMLTTFNEGDMTNAMALRNQYKDIFERRHGIRIGFMSIFIKAAIEALKAFPAVNAEIDGDDIVYKNYYDVSVAVGSPQGLVVPVVRDADKLSFAEIEKTIADFGKRAREGKLTMEEMMGGTFTISNGGVYGSLLSTPILNPPQSGILGMHKIQLRPMVMGDGTIEARPMMYLALSYDHRIVDGREAVSFLVRLKECIEDPQRMMLDT